MNVHHEAHEEHEEERRIVFTFVFFVSSVVTILFSSFIIQKEVNS